MKKLLIAAGLGLFLAAGVTGPADAKTNVKIYLGYPHYDYRVGPDYRFRKGYGWYNPAYRARLSCEAAYRQVARRGFRNIKTVECRGQTYTFRATRNGNRQVVYVDARTGALMR